MRRIKRSRTVQNRLPANVSDDNDDYLADEIIWALFEAQKEMLSELWWAYPYAKASGDMDIPTTASQKAD